MRWQRIARSASTVTRWRAVLTLPQRFGWRPFARSVGGTTALAIVGLRPARSIWRATALTVLRLPFLRRHWSALLAGGRGRRGCISPYVRRRLLRRWRRCGLPFRWRLLRRRGRRGLPFRRRLPWWRWGRLRCGLWRRALPLRSLLRRRLLFLFLLLLLPLFLLFLGQRRLLSERPLHHKPTACDHQNRQSRTEKCRSRRLIVVMRCQGSSS